MHRRIMRALISVTDKGGVVDFAKALEEMGVEIISTGGTAARLREGGVKVTDVSEVTGFPEMLEGRVKTLHPRIHAGILAKRSDPTHRAELTRHHIAPIDLVCVNLYAFEQTVARPECTLEMALENIDIGGPCLLRAAAKNFPDVVVVCDPADYEAVIKEMRANDGWVGQRLRAELATKAFRLTSSYDRAIAEYLEKAASGEGGK